MNGSDKSDAILNDALAEYRDAEPLAGIEERILHRVQSPPVCRQAVFLRWMAAGIAVAAFAIVVWVGWRSHAADEPVVPAPPKQMAGTSALPAQPRSPALALRERINLSRETRPASRSVRTFRSGRHILEAKSMAVPERFPTPSPLTPQERALLALADRDPRALRTLASNNNEIVIQPIIIPPLSGEPAEHEGDN